MGMHLTPHPSLPITLLALTLGAACGPLEEGEEAVSIDNLSSGTLDTSNTPFANAVVRWNGCTATLISPRHLLTAAHCRGFGLSEPGVEMVDRTWYYHVPSPVAATGMTSGRRRVDGTFSWESGFDRRGADYRSFVTSSATNCRNTCAGEARCKAFTHASGRCYLKSPDTWAPVNFGPSGTHPYVARALAVAKPGFEDILLVALAEPVPAGVAVPIPPLLAGPGADAVSYFAGQPITMVGYGGYLGAGGTEVYDGKRRRGTARLITYPFTSFGVRQPNMFRLGNATSCATVLPGDSGSPALWTDADGTRYVIGAAQGSESCGGRYLATFGTGGVDSAGNTKPHISSWLGNELRVSNVEWSLTFPGPHPANLRKLAACSDAMLGLDAGGGLYRRPYGGAWSYMRGLGSGVRDIACGDTTPFVLSASAMVSYVGASGVTPYVQAPSDAVDLSIAGVFAPPWVARSDNRAYQWQAGAWTQHRRVTGDELEAGGQSLLSVIPVSSTNHLLYLRDFANVNAYRYLGTHSAVDFALGSLPAVSDPVIFRLTPTGGIEQAALHRGNAPRD